MMTVEEMAQAIADLRERMEMVENALKRNGASPCQAVRYFLNAKALKVWAIMHDMTLGDISEAAQLPMSALNNYLRGTISVKQEHRNKLIELTSLPHDDLFALTARNDEKAIS